MKNKSETKMRVKDKNGHVLAEDVKVRDLWIIVRSCEILKGKERHWC